MTTTVLEHTEAETEIENTTEFQLVARNSTELSAAHAKMIEWAERMQVKCETERAEQQANLDISVTNGWANSPTFERRIARLSARIEFYAKIEAALRAGYCIVPNFEMDVFAIRTTRGNPTGRPRTGWSNDFTQAPQRLPIGEGDYVHSQPVVHQRKDTVPDSRFPGQTREEWTQWPVAFKDVEFPIAIAKPVLMAAAAKATADKLFDEIGIARDTQGWRGARAGDPFLLGRLRNPRRAPDVTFFLGWYFDPSRV